VTAVLHRAGGLTIEADAYLPGLNADAGSGVPDVRLQLGSPPRWHESPDRVVHEADDGRGHLLIRVTRSREGYCFLYADDTRVWLDQSGTRVWCTWATDLESAATYLTGPILVCILRLRGALTLHASAVQIGRVAIGLAGPHGAGKSTTAAALAVRGHGVLTDDVLCASRTQVGWVVQPGGNLIRLWPAGAALALGPSPALPLLARGWDKRALHLGDRGTRQAIDAVRLAGIAVLTPGTVSAVRRPIVGAESLVAIAANVSGSHLLDRRQRAGEFDAVASVSRSVRVLDVETGGPAADFGGLIDEIERWGESLDA
jgi:hypothetical protein